MTMRVLVTGAAGFVGFHLAQALKRACGGDAEIIATSKTAGNHPAYGGIAALDVQNTAAVVKEIKKQAPTHIIHLAGIAAPSAANANPCLAWKVHVGSALNLCDAILRHAPACRLIHVGTGLVYGATARSGQPLDEDALLAPTDSYAASKAAADLALGAMSQQGLKCIRLRPFNHSGPGQSDAFVIPAFARQIAAIEAGVTSPRLLVGNLDAERDFLDVRDVVDAYALAALRVDEILPGTILNIASGTPRRIGDILETLLSLAKVKIKVVSDPARMRPSDLRRIVGSAERARRVLGWSPQYDFNDMIAAILDDWRTRIATD